MIKLGTIGTNWITQQFVDAVKSTGLYDVTTVIHDTLKRLNNLQIKMGRLIHLMI